LELLQASFQEQVVAGNQTQPMKKIVRKPLSTLRKADGIPV